MRSMIILLLSFVLFVSSSYAQVRDPNIKLNGDVHKLIVEKSEKYNISVNLILAIIMQESTGRCGATSSAGAIGLMQIKYITAKEIGYRGAPEGLYDCKTNIKYGMKYLAMAAEKANGSTCLMLHYYFAGIYSNPWIPESSHKYCQSVMRHMG